MTTERRYGFIGLGQMGEPMARAMLAAGLDVTVFDLRREPMARLVAEGARSAADVVDLARTVDVVHVMVVDEDEVRRVVEGPQGALGALRPSTSTVVIHSTISPAACVRLADVAAASSVGLLDAPVTGGVWAAESGELTVMVGGDPAALERVTPALEALAEEVVHVGAVGSGQAVKIVNNMVTILNRHTLRAALALVEACGVDTETALGVMRRGSAGSWAADRYDAFSELASRHPDGAGHLADVARKDLELVLEIAATVGHLVPSVQLALDGITELYATHVAHGRSAT